MLYHLFPKVRNSKFIKGLNWFLSSYIYIGIIATLTMCSDIFGIEIYFYYFVAISSCLIPCLLCDDMTAVIPPLGMCYCSFSIKHNNAKEGISLFQNPTFIKNFIAVVAIIVVFLLARLIFDIVKLKRNKKIYPRFLLGFVLLGITYISAGIGTRYFTDKSKIFGLIELLTLTIPYFYLTYTIDWTKNKKTYIGFVLLMLGAALLGEVVYNYIDVLVIQKVTVEEFNRDMIITGWAVYNNIGGMMCMCIAGPIYLSTKYKQSWVFVLLSAILCIGNIATQSRSAILMGFLIFIIGMIFAIIYTKRAQRIMNFISFAVIIIGISATVLFLGEKVIDKLEFTFKEFFEGDKNTSSAGRLEIWTAGFKNFLYNPLFGTGWYKITSYRHWNFNTDFMPARYHNTLVQILATTGAIGMSTYLYHRVETLIVLFKKFNKDKFFIYLSIAGLLLTALLDCHFFNFGPGLLYSILLICLEKDKIKREFE